MIAAALTQARPTLVVSAVINGASYLATRSHEPTAGAAFTTLPQQILVQGLLSGVVAAIAFCRAVVLLGAPCAAAFPAVVPVAAILPAPVAGEIPTALQIIGLLIVTVACSSSSTAPRHQLPSTEDRLMDRVFKTALASLR